MRPREILHQTTTPDGQPLELVREGGHFVLRVGSVPLMSSAASGSEQAMARVARDALAAAAIEPKRVLVGGLGMGFTLRATLETFPKSTLITVAEILPAVIAYNRGVLGPLAKHPLADPRVTLHEGNVTEQLEPRTWDAILMDVDNGPDAFTLDDNADLYSEAGVRQMAAALRPKGVLVLWSAYPSRTFERVIGKAGLVCRTHRVSARTPERQRSQRRDDDDGSAPGPSKGKGGKHVLFVGTRPR